jgi:hypothetical protein
MFKDMRDMQKSGRQSLKDLPETMANAQQAVANAQAVAAAHQQLAAQQMAAATTAAPVDTAGPDFQPIEGVSLELYVTICKGIAAAGNDQSQGPALAAANGISAAAWESASAGWPARMTQNRAVGQQFNVYYNKVG